MDRMRAVVGVMVFALGSLSPAFAANRTFVSGSGSDLNPCTHDQPCRSFNAAIAVTTPGGEVIAVDSAGYGQATITTAINLVAAPGVHAGISASGTGILVNAGPSDTVTLRNLYITSIGGANGIQTQNGAILDIQGCVITGFSSYDVLVTASTRVYITNSIVRNAGSSGMFFNTAKVVMANSRVDGCANGIYVTDGSLTMRESSVSNNTFNGLVSLGNAKVDILSSTFTGNANGVWPVVSGVLSIRDSVIAQNSLVGIKVESQGQGTTVEAHIENCTITSNGNYGVYVNGFPGTTEIATVSNCLIAGNSGTGVFLAGTGTNVARLTGNTITRNDVGVSINPGTTAYSPGDNVIDGNISFQVLNSLTAITKM